MSEAGRRGGDWHVRSAGEVCRELSVVPADGLSVDEVARRRARFGPNRLDEGRRRGPLRMLLDQFADFMVLVLLASAVLAGILGEPQDSLAIAVILTLNAVLGFAQEYRAERAVRALQALGAPQARVWRDGGVAVVPGEDIVPGDVVLLDAGSAVPADVRIVEAAQLRIDESALTGESQPVEKRIDALVGGDLALGDRTNLAFKGTLVTYGRGRGVVVATGMETELGRVAALLDEADDGRTPLQRRLADFGRRLALAVLALCAVLFVVGVLRGEEPVLMFLTAVSLAVAAIPEALPAVVTVALALGARKMVRANALIRRLPAVETLGSVTCVCSDKTGTLTENRMRVEAFHVDGRDTGTPPGPGQRSVAWNLLLAALALSNDAEPRGDGAEGDPTEVALLLAALRAEIDKRELAARMPRLAEVAFSSERARMTTIHSDPDGGLVAFTKGAPEHVLPSCRDVDLPAMLDAADDMARRGLRVLAFASRRLERMPEEGQLEDIETGMTLLGLVGLIDPPRAEAAEAVALCRTAGIRVVMITGDHPATARAIATRLGIVDDGGRVVSGAELARLDRDAFAAEVESIRVYARVAPEQKIQIVEALQKHGELVAMTGDGVNDAPALRQAEIGVAMGKGGTDVAREAAHMVLLDDNFASIVGAVREGRRIYDNIRKFIKFAFASNTGEIWTLFLAPLVGLPIPLLPIHILWVNLVTDGLPGLALTLEPAEREIMQRPPRPPRESIFAHGLWQHAVWVGLLLGGVTLSTQAWALRTGLEHWQTMTFTVLTLSQMGHVLAVRSEHDSLLTQGLLSNRPLLGAVVLTILLQCAVIYLPVSWSIFKTQPLTGGELALCFAVASIVFVAVEIEKWMVRRGWLYRAEVNAG